MSGPVQISSPAQLTSLLSSSRVVVVNFYKESSSTSKALSGVYDQLANQLSRPNLVTFTKVDVDQQAQIAESYSATSLPTFIIFRNGAQINKVNGANPQQLSNAIRQLATEAESDGGAGGNAEGSSSSGGSWRGAGLPRGYTDVTDHVDVRGLDLLNSDSDFGSVRTLFETSMPTTLAMGKGKGKKAASGSEGKKDWVESDVDEQLMLYLPFTATLKVHTIHITSCPPKADEDEDDDEIPIRPKTIHLYTNRQHNLGFEEAEDIPATQTIELKTSDWDEKTGTAKLELRFVKFQNVASLIMFVVDGDGEGEKTRIDRIRIIGDAGEKLVPAKLEKIDHDS
ncbi:DUF1000-domain-containing protein [Pleomassaria siparia CBS 279.74]|uniref:DUF1000-domain-containing protein n=1 Tax=Pleomassaria siparia CBS 279.74 TaxID=1314801 RepID=A0A6G1KC18_9PLEO|nr:DUF1000-domain-containing protein [Pleomassaria siparia CBS 279.74]